MDEPTLGEDPDELMGTFDELNRINHWLGGYGPSLDGIGQLLPGRCRRFSLLDVGTGGGDLLRHVAAWASRRRIETDLTGLDSSAPVIAIARQRATRGARAGESLAPPNFVCADLLSFPGRARFDIVHAALTLHHLSDTDVSAALARMMRLARVGVVVNDLHRHPVAYGSIRVLTAMFSRNRLIKHDAPLSVLRGFTKDELLTLTRRAELPNPLLRWRWAFRWQLVIRA